MSLTRPISQSSSHYSNSKPAFQKKLRPRIRGLSNMDEQFNTSIDLTRQVVNTQADFYSSRSEVLLNDNKHLPNSEMNKTSSQLTQINFNNHCSSECLCNECNCGRHMCKFNNIKPDMSKTTVYQKDFERKSVTPSQVIYAKEYNKLEGPHLDMNSTQRAHFTNRDGDKLERPIPEDLLKRNGPTPILTTYKSLFPGHKGPNQYVKPTDKHIREKFPLRSKSTYTKTFVNKNMKKDDYKYFNDQLKTGGNWYGSTSYGNFFDSPNPEYHAKKVKVVQKLEENLGFNHQYETVYKNDFIPKETTVCGSKIHMETRGSGQYLQTKGKFAENSDFKAMSPMYQTFSKSGFKFV